MTPLAPLQLRHAPGVLMTPSPNGTVHCRAQRHTDAYLGGRDAPAQGRVLCPGRGMERTRSDCGVLRRALARGSRAAGLALYPWKRGSIRDMDVTTVKHAVNMLQQP